MVKFGGPGYPNFLAPAMNFNSKVYWYVCWLVIGHSVKMKSFEILRNILNCLQSWEFKNFRFLLLIKELHIGESFLQGLSIETLFLYPY